MYCGGGLSSPRRASSCCWAGLPGEDSSPSMDPQRAHAVQLAHAYADCRAIARSAAKNFYYSFLALPRPKRDAICAVYAFMRRADDIADLGQLPAAERQQKLE